MAMVPWPLVLWDHGLLYPCIMFHSLYLLCINISGLNIPHSHPRASEVQIIVQGGPVQAAFIMEDGARIVSNTIPIGSATIYP